MPLLRAGREVEHSIDMCSYEGECRGCNPLLSCAKSAVIRLRDNYFLIPEEKSIFASHFLNKDYLEWLVPP